MDWTKPESFQNKTGVIGVLRVGEKPCGRYEGTGSGFLRFGKNNDLGVLLDNQSTDGLFGKELSPGSHKLHYYNYNCTVGYQRKCSKEGCYDVPINKTFYKKPKARFVVKVPTTGFCKVLISFRNGILQTGEDNEFMRDFFIENNVALDFDEVPYCESEHSETFAQ